MRDGSVGQRHGARLKLVIDNSRRFFSGKQRVVDSGAYDAAPFRQFSLNADSVGEAVFPAPIADSAGDHTTNASNGGCPAKLIYDVANGGELFWHEPIYSSEMNNVKSDFTESETRVYGLSIGAMIREISEDSLLAVAIRLKAARRALKRTQRALCVALAVQPNTWNQWERAKYLPDVMAMGRLADKYGVTLDWIYRGRADTMQDRLAEKITAEYEKLAADADVKTAS